jgi:hypothetical protein
MRQELTNSSVADPGCLSRITDPICSIPEPGVTISRIPDPDRHQQVVKNKIQDVHSGSGFFSIPDPGFKKSTGPRIRIRNTDEMNALFTKKILIRSFYI